MRFVLHLEGLLARRERAIGPAHYGAVRRRRGSLVRR